MLIARRRARPATPTQPLVAALTASVFEPGGRPVREGMTLKVRTKPLYLGRQGRPGRRAAADAADRPSTSSRSTPSGARVAAPGATWTLITENWDYDWFQQDGRWQWRRTSRDAVVAKGAVNIGAGAPARAVQRACGWGDYRLELDRPGRAPRP